MVPSAPHDEFRAWLRRAEVRGVLLRGRVLRAPICVILQLLSRATFLNEGLPQNVGWMASPPFQVH